MKNVPIDIAIADYHPIVRKGISDLLREKGFSVVVEEANGLELIKGIQDLVALPDVCILDINMPEMDGYEAVKILSSRWPSIKTLAFTALRSDYSFVRMISNGARGYLLKELDIANICNAVVEILEVGYYCPQEELRSLFTNLPVEGSLKKYKFSEMEMQFIKFCSTELTYKEMADRMKVSLRVIDTYRENLFQRLELKCRSGLVMFAVKSGIVAF